MTAENPIVDWDLFHRELYHAYAELKRTKAISGWSDIAKASGVCSRSIHSIRSGEHRPGTDIFLRLCIWMGVDPRKYADPTKANEIILTKDIEHAK